MKSLYEFVINSKSIGIIKDSYFVDLGLDVLWAKCNIGAKKETDYGHYYQWGGLEPMDAKECNWDTAPFNNRQFDFDKKYFNRIKNKVCPNGILSKKYDIAYQTYKGKVHMLTDDNFKELIENTNNEWITNYNDSDVNGRLFTGKNGSNIFIPAAGYRMGSKFYDQGSNACVWSSMVNTYSSYYARYLNFYEDNVSPNRSNNRCYGLSVRAVKEK